MAMSSEHSHCHIFQNMCRVCGKSSSQTINLFGIRKKGLILAEMLAICTQTNIQRTDLRPSNICSSCLSNLEIAFDFYNLVKSSEDQFQRIVSNSTHIPEVQPNNIPCVPTETIECSEIEISIPKLDFSSVEAEYLKSELDEEPHHQPQIAQIHEQYDVSNEYLKKREEQNRHRQELKKRRKNRLFECFMCKKKLKSFTDTRNHLKRHKEGTPFRCKICSMYYSEEQFQQHLCRGQSVQCDYCFDCFETTRSLLDHLDSHKDQHNLHKCSECSKIFPMVFLLDCHRAQHAIIEKPYVCRICNHRFRLHFLLKKHLATHSNERPHLCSTCGMGFKTLGTLRSHAIRHSGVKPVACTKCPKRFFSNADLRKHMDVHSDAKYICNLCGATLSSKRSLDEHRRHRHRKAEEQTCDLCSMKFRTVYNLKRHLLTHTGEKPHKCIYCAKAFAQSGDLNKHLRSHVGEKTYQCNLCLKSFRLQIELRKHSYEHFQSEEKDDTNILT